MSVVGQTRPITGQITLQESLGVAQTQGLRAVSRREEEEEDNRWSHWTGATTVDLT